MPVPWALLLGTFVAGYSGARALVRPYRGALMEHATVEQCAGGSACNRYMVVKPLGDPSVMALARGRVVMATGNELTIVPDNEAVVLLYRGVSPQVEPGARVKPGEVVATSTELAFGVSRIVRAVDGAISYQPLEPASYLAARGMRVSGKRVAKSELWCAGGRRLHVPEQVARCSMKLPEPAGFALLPVSVSME